VNDAQIRSGKQGTLAAWQYPQLRLLLVSSLGTFIGRWIETVVGTWLILELTGSSFMVGLLGVCRFAGMALGPLCGAVADRVDRRRLLLTVQMTYAISALIILTLFVFRQLDAWHLFLFTIIGGICYSFDYSTRYVVAADLVKGEHLISAISLVIVVNSGTAVLGPLMGGSLLEIIGTEGCFALIAVSFLVSYFSLFCMKTPLKARLKTEAPFWKNIVDGFIYIKNHRAVLALILLAAMANLFIFSYWFTLIPIFARDILMTDATGYGLLMAAVGLGSAVGSLAAGRVSKGSEGGRLVVISVLAWPVVLLIFAFSRLFPLSFALLLFAGAAQGLAMTLIQALILIWSAEDMRGRVSGARGFAIGPLLLGNLFAGAGASLMGAPMTLILNASLAIIVTIVIIAWAVELRHGKSPA